MTECGTSGFMFYWKSLLNDDRKFCLLMRCSLNRQIEFAVIDSIGINGSIHHPAVSCSLARCMKATNRLSVAGSQTIDLQFVLMKNVNVASNYRRANGIEGKLFSPN